MKRKRIVAEIEIVSLNDEKLRDRMFLNGQKGVAIYKLPVRATYLCEGYGYRSTCKKALAMAAADGIGAASVGFWIDTDYLADDPR